LNSKDNNNKSVVFQFVAVSLLFVLWFVLNYVDETILLKRIRLGMDHLKLLSQRTPDVRFVLSFSLEELAENDLNAVYQYPSISFCIFNIKAKISKTGDNIIVILFFRMTRIYSTA
jgi:hypothetical protein